MPRRQPPRHGSLGRCFGRRAGAAGRAVAMGQAPDEVREAANEVGGPVDEAGLAAVLDSLP